MRALVQVGGFLVLSLGLHLGVLAVGSARSGAVAAGDGGDAVVTLAASSAALAALVAGWDSPPEIATDVAVEAAPVPEAAPDLTGRQEAGVRRAEARALPVIAPDDPARAPEALPVFPAPQAMLGALPLMPAPDAAVVEKPVLIADQRPAMQAPTMSDVGADTAPMVDAAPFVPPVRPKAKPQSTASDAVAAQVAAGAGAGVEAGQAGKASAAVAGTAGDARLLARWGGQIRNRIERHKRYPHEAAGAGGTTLLALQIAGDGRLLAVEVVRGSGNAALDQAALAAVRNAGPFTAAPEGMRDDAHQLSLPITFTR